MNQALSQRWATISPLLDELLELDERPRAARLAQLRSADAALAQELAELLAEQGELDAEAFLEGAAPGVPQEVSLAGQQIGAYTLVSPLGAGGMGSVWLARRSDGRYEGQVAVKLLNLALLGRGGAERFAREGQLLARLAHPNIARLLDAGVTRQGQPYLVLEHVQGEPIDRYCTNHGLDVTARVRLMLDVLAAVAHAHGKLVLHRDLKPANILVSADGQVKLLDFGIAKLLEDEGQGAQATALTELGGRAFTPDFAAPEQVQGGEVTTATDVYALGVLLYLLLSGGHPTIKSTDSPVDRLRSVVETEPQRLSQAAGATPPRVAQALRGDLDNIVAKALKKSPAERYAGVQALADDLRRYLADEPVAARADTLAYRSAKFVRRNRLAVGAAALVALTLVAGIVGTAWQAIEARRERDAAVYQAERANARGNLVNLVMSSLGDPDRPLTQREILARSVDLVNKRFAADPKLAVDLLQPIAGQYLSIADTKNELAVMTQAALHARRSGDLALIAGVACNTVDTQYRLGQAEAAKQQLSEGLAALAQVPRPGVGLRTSCLRAQADVGYNDGKFDQAVEHITAALRLIEREGQPRNFQYDSLQSYLQMLQWNRGDWRAVHGLVQQRKKQWEASGMTGTVDYVGGVRDEAVVHYVWGEVRTAQAILAPLLARFAGAGDAGQPPTWFENTRGVLLLRLGSLAEAHAVLAQAAERARAQGNLGSAKSIEWALAETLVAMGRLNEAERVIARADSTRAQGSPWRVTSAILRAELLLARGDHQAALQLVEPELPKLHPMQQTLALARGWRLVAVAQLAAGHPAEARAAALSALAVSERVARQPDASADVGEALLLLARAEKAVGADARKTAQRAAKCLAESLGEPHPLARQARALSG